MTQQMENDFVSPNATSTIFEKFGIEIEFGSPPLYTNPFLIAPSPLPSKRSPKYLERLTTLGYTESDQAIIHKLHLGWTLCYTKWPAFHWDANALKSNAGDWIESGDEMIFDIGGDPCLFKCHEREMEAVVGPQDSNSVVAVSVPVSDGSDEVVVINTNPAEIISDDVKAEDIPRYGTPDFKILRSSHSNPSGPNVTSVATDIPPPPSRLGSEDAFSSFEHSESGFDFDLDSEWFHRFASSFKFPLFESDSEQSDLDVKAEDIPPYGTSSPSNPSGPIATNIPRPPSGLGSEDACCSSESGFHGFDSDSDLSEWSLRSFSKFNRFASSIKFPSIESDSEQFDLESSPVENKESELRNMIGSSLATLLDLDESEECFGEDGDDEKPPVLLYSSGVSTSDFEAGLETSNPDVALVDTNIKLSKQTQPSMAGDTSLFIPSTLPIPPFPESNCQGEPITNCPRLQTKLDDKQGGAITNEVGAQLRCGCEGCRPALFGHWGWPLDGLKGVFSK